MITINAIRLRRILEQKNKTLDDLKNIFILRSYATDMRLSRLSHTSTDNLYPDAFIYEIARELNVSVDYLLGWDESPGFFVELHSKPKDKLFELQRLLLKYCTEQKIEKKNTNVLAFKTGLDRDVIRYIMEMEEHSAWWICTSYYVISRLAVTFDFNFYTVMGFMLDMEEFGTEAVTRLSEKFEAEYHIKTL